MFLNLFLFSFNTLKNYNKVHRIQQTPMFLLFRINILTCVSGTLFLLLPVAIVSDMEGVLEYFEEKLAIHWNLMFIQFHAICVHEKFLMLVHWRGERQTKEGEL